MKLEIYRLIREVCNPDYDRRARHGVRSVEILPIGTKIVIRREQENAGDVAYPLVSFRTVSDTTIDFSRRDFVRQVVAASELVKPESFREFLMIHDEEDYTAHRIMERLFQHPEGRILIEAAMVAEQN